MLPFVHELIATQTRCSPNAPAVVGQDRTLSYRELDHRSNAMAHALAGRGVRAGALVGLCIERHSELLVALLGILKCGAVYVPLDASHPAARLAGLLHSAQAELVLTESALRSALPADVDCLCLDSEDARALLAAQPRDAAPTVAVGADPLAYIMFTSGSTGRPKGVQVRHAAIANLMAGMQDLFQLRREDRWLALAPVTFDISVLELFMPLCQGACVVLATREQAMDAARLAHLLRDQRITVLQATPATWRMLQTVPSIGDAFEPPLRLAACGGEGWGRDLRDFLVRMGRQVWNVYGPTETTVWSTALKIDALGDVHLGYPLRDTAVWVLDDALQPVAPGVPGELHIGGAGLARGYLGQPELTAERFIEHPLWSGRLYKTGDLVSRRADGGLNYLGRIDFQIKLRGHRIELGEIEAALLQHPSVHQAVVIGRNDGGGPTRLVAYYQLRESAEPATLRGHLNALLPAIMIPTDFVQVDALPLNSNGKIDRQALPAPSRLRTVPSSETPPRTVNEAILAHMWADVLEVDRVDTHSNFFDLGGDSLRATELLLLVNHRFGSDLALSVLLSHATVEEMARLVGQPSYEAVVRRSMRLNSASADRVALFCVPPIGGVATVFLPLARALSGRVTLHGLQVSGIRYARDQTLVMPQLVNAFADEIQQVCPSGPLNLAGYSAGGAVLHALCDVLLERGREIDRVVLLNPYCRPPVGASDYDHTADFWNVCTDLVGDAFDLRGPAAEPLLALSRAMWSNRSGRVDGESEFAWPRELANAETALPRNVSPEVYEMLMQGVHATWMAYRQYRVAPLDSPHRFKQICLFQPDAEPEEYRDLRAREWSTYMKAPLSRKLVPGEHARLLRSPDSVAAIARHIADMFSRC